MAEKKAKTMQMENKTDTKQNNRLSKPIHIIGIITIIILIFFLINAINKFWIDNLLGIVLIALILFHYKKFHLNWFGFLLISVFLIMHNLGSFGIYSQPFYGYAWDKIVHFFYGIAWGIVAFTYFVNADRKRTIASVIIYSIFFVMAISVFHEIIEYLGATILGPGDGILFFGAGDELPGDTEWDLIYGFMGSFLSTVVAGISYKLKNNLNGKAGMKTIKKRSH